MAKSDEKKELSADEKFELLLTALTQKQSEGLTPDTLKELLAETAKATQRAMRPENDTHPHISAFTKPGGYLANPHETLVCDTFYRGFPVHKAYETHHWREIELLNQVKPGEYVVLRKDLTPMKVSVKGEYDAKQTLTKKEIVFDVTREERHYIPSMTVLLYQLVHHDRPVQQVYLEAMQEDLKQQMAAVSA